MQSPSFCILTVGYTKQWGFTVSILFWRLLVISLGEKLISNKAQNLAKQSLENWRQWQAPFQSQPKIVQQLEGGLTNTNYLIEAGSQRAVLRINNPQADKLGVNRQAEITILKKLHFSDFVPRFYFADNSILVTEYIDGCPLDAETALKPDIKKQIEQTIKAIQSIEINDFAVRNYQSYLREYCNQLSPQDLDESLRQALFQIARNIDNQDWSPVLCHHDLIPENIIQSAKGLFIIDWEYASLGHPKFDFLRIFSHVEASEKLTSNSSKQLHAFQVVMDQLWYAIRYPEKQKTILQKLTKIIEKVRLKK